MNMNIGKFKTHLKTLKYMAITLLVMFGGIKVIEWISYYPRVAIEILIGILLIFLYVTVYKLVELSDD